MAPANSAGTTKQALQPSVHRETRRLRRSALLRLGARYSKGPRRFRVLLPRTNARGFARRGESHSLKPSVEHPKHSQGNEPALKAEGQVHARGKRRPLAMKTRALVRSPTNPLTNFEKP